jgi:hypothetical protein
VADAHPDLVKRAKRHMDDAHVPNANWVNRPPKKKR